ncbi:MAG: hypothetical protein KKB25_02460, partial [Nanoarchaeota archaeon]|nr:hypothetical protein [Nanoarchaeota archaeon]
MKDNGQILVSASVLKEAFRKKQNCEISPLVLYFIQKKIREHKENNMQPYADVKINSMSNGKGFHEESYSILRNGFANSGKKDAIAFRLLKMRKRSREVLIEPTIFSEKSRMIGEP